MTIPVKLGGTGGTTQASARTGLGLKEAATKTLNEIASQGAVADALNLKAGKGANIDITSIAGLTTPLAQNQGGTGATTLESANLAVNGVTSSLGSKLGILQNSQQAGLVVRQTWAEVDALATTANVTYQVPATDTGTHAGVAGELGYNSTTGQVPNRGTFNAYGTPLLKRRVADVVNSAPISPLSKAKDLQLAFQDPATQTFTVLSVADSATFLQEIGMPTLYSTDLTDVVLTETSSLILPEDAQRSGDLLIQIIDGAADIALNFSGKQAVFSTQGTWAQASGEWVNHGDVGTLAVSGIAKRKVTDTNTGALSVKLNVRVKRRVAGALPDKTADSIFARWTDPSDSRIRDVIRTEILYLQNNGIYDKLKVLYLPTATLNNSLVNLADPNGPLFVQHPGSAAIVHVPYSYTKGNGTDQYIDTQRLPDAIGQTTDGFVLGAKVFDTGAAVFDNTGYLAGNTISHCIQPARSNGFYGFRSGGGLDSNDTALANYKWATQVRVNDGNNLTAFVDETKAFTKARVSSALTTRTLNLLATNGTGGIGSPSALPLHGAFAGFGLQDQSVIRLIQSLKRIQAVMATIASGG